MNDTENAVSELAVSELNNMYEKLMAMLVLFEIMIESITIS